MLCLLKQEEVDIQCLCRGNSGREKGQGDMVQPKCLGYHHALLHTSLSPPFPLMRAAIRMHNTLEKQDSRHRKATQYMLSLDTALV
jgi:hypothetical protein